MSDMKCPICDSYLHKIPVKEAWVCGTHDTKDELYGSKELWQELIRTRKALDVAVDMLKEIDELLSSNRFDVKEVPLLNITQTKISMLLKCINIAQKE